MRQATKQERRQSHRATGVKCSRCGREIIALNKLAYDTIVANDGLFDMYCNACLGRSDE